MQTAKLGKITDRDIFKSNKRGYFQFLINEKGPNLLLIRSRENVR